MIFARQSLVWNHAKKADWPDARPAEDDLRWARDTDTAMFCDVGDQRLFLIQRDWADWPDPPEWGLASYDKGSGCWHHVAEFDGLPGRWAVPEIINASN